MEEFIVTHVRRATYGKLFVGAAVTFDFKQRARNKFSASNEALLAQIEGVIAEHGQKGIVQSGATIKRSLTIYEEYTSQALKGVLEEQAKLVAHRGRKWKKAGCEIGVALSEQATSARDILKRPLKLAGADSANDASKAVDRLLVEIDGRLHAQLIEFQAGWTAPRPEGWHERHPFAYALALLVIGALVGAVADTAFAFLD